MEFADMSTHDAKYYVDRYIARMNGELDDRQVDIEESFKNWRSSKDHSDLSGSE